MIKKFSLFMLSFVLFASLYAQTIQETEVRIGDQNVPGFIATVSQDYKTVQEALKQKLKAAKVKTSTSDSYTAVLGQIVNEIASVPINMYIRIDNISRRSENSTSITICAMTMNIADKVPDLNNNVSRFLDDIVKQARRAEASVQLAADEKNLKKAQDNHNDATAELEKLNKTVQKNQDKIVSNQKEIEKLKSRLKDLENENASLQNSIDKAADTQQKLKKNIEETVNALKEAQDKVDKQRAAIQ